MKKIIASLGKDLDSDIALNAARAPYFLVLVDNKLVDVIKNPFVHGGGAGFAVAQLLKDQNCDLFLARKIGDNLRKSLDNYGIKYELEN